MGFTTPPAFSEAMTHASEAHQALCDGDHELAACLLCEALIALRFIPNRAGGDPLRDALINAARDYLAAGAEED